MAPVVRGRKGEFAKLFEDLRREGFSRVRVDGEVRSLDDSIELDKKYKHDIQVVVDRIVIRENSLGRIAEGVELSLIHIYAVCHLHRSRRPPQGGNIRHIGNRAWDACKMRAVAGGLKRDYRYDGCCRDVYKRQISITLSI